MKINKQKRRLSVTIIMRTGMKILSKTFQKTMSHFVFNGRKTNFLPLLLDGWFEHQSHIKTIFPKVGPWKIADQKAMNNYHCTANFI